MSGKKKCTFTDGSGEKIECPPEVPPYKDRVVFDPGRDNSFELLTLTLELHIDLNAPFMDVMAYNVLNDSADPYIRAKSVCETSCGVKPTRDLYWNCERRVYKKRLYTAETCDEEFVDLMEAIDKCAVREKAFLKIL